MHNRQRVLFLIPHLGGGGAERVVARLAVGLSQEKYEIHLGLVTMDSVAAGVLPEFVTVYALGARRVRAAIVPLLALIWRLKPALIFSGIFHLNFLVLALRPFLPRETRVIVRQNGVTSSAAGVSHGTRLMYRILYPHADAIVCQSEDMAKAMSGLLGDAGKLRVLRNPVKKLQPLPSDLRELWNHAAGPNLLAVGRLAPSKGFDLLLAALAALVTQFPAARLTILGDGPEQVALQTLARELGIAEQVHFAGYVERPQEWLVGTSVFVLSSRHEAMSNAMLEAAAAGLPIVATPALGGVAALLQGQPGTWVANDMSAEALAESLRDALATLRPGMRVKHEWIEPFFAENSLAAYERLFDEVLAGAAR